MLSERTKYIFRNILWCIDKPKQNEIVKAAIATSHLVYPGRGVVGHNERQIIRKQLLETKGIKYTMHLE